MKNFVNFRPIFYFAIAVILGIVSGYYFYIGSPAFAVAIISLCAVVLLFVCLCSKNHRKRYLIFSAVFALIFCFGALNFSKKVTDFDSASSGSFTLSVRGKITQASELDGAKRFILTDLSFKGALNGFAEYGLSLYVRGDTIADLGDIIIFTAEVCDKSVFYDGSFRANDIAEGIRWTAEVEAEDVEITGNDSNLLEKARCFIRNSLKDGLDGNEYAVAYAMLIGNTDYIEEDVLNNFRALGVAHIFAVSGLHIGFVAGVINFLLKRLKISSFIKVAITAAFVFLYSGICGFSASSVRASVMSVVLLSVRSFGKKYDRLSSLGVAALIVLSYSPTELFRVGFQLSFTVVFGIMTCSNLLSKPFKIFGEKVSSSLGVSLSAWLFGLPISLIVFGETGILSVIANLLLLSVIGFVFVLLLICTCVGGAVGACRIFLFPVRIVLKLITSAATAFDYTALTVGGISFGGFVLLFYLAFIAAAGYFNIKKTSKIVLSICLAAIFCVGSVRTTVRENGKVTVTVTGDYSCSCVLVKKGDDVVLFVSELEESSSLSRLTKLLNNIPEKEIDNLVFLDGSSELDYIAAIARLISVAEINRVYTGDCISSTTFSIMKKNFPLTEFERVSAGESVNLENVGKFYYFLDFRAVNVKTNEKVMKIYSALEVADDLIYADRDYSCDLAVCENFSQFVGLANPNATVASFRSGRCDLNAEEQGNLKRYFY